jgi:hypothetical protein
MCRQPDVGATPALAECIRLFILVPIEEDRPHLVQVRITKLVASSLDMSDRAIRMMIASTASFEDMFTDLLDAVPAADQCLSYVGSVPRYLRLTRSKLLEATVRRVSLDDYVTWVTAIDAESTSASAANRVFECFAQLASPDLDKAAEPRNILLDLQPLDNFGAIRRRPRGPCRCLVRFRRDGRDLAVATVERDKQFLGAEMAMAGEFQRTS